MEDYWITKQEIIEYFGGNIIVDKKDYEFFVCDKETKVINM